jgi:hypothetical protein
MDEAETQVQRWEPWRNELVCFWKELHVGEKDCEKENNK